jgi:hypothetical protein
MMFDDEPVEVLSIGSIIGGWTSRSRGWREPMRVLTCQIITRQVGVVSDINVNVEFHVPGNILGVDFEGVRTGYFRKRDRLLRCRWRWHGTRHRIRGPC